jgi:hypothetical protein
MDLLTSMWKPLQYPHLLESICLTWYNEHGINIFKKNFFFMVYNIIAKWCESNDFHSYNHNQVKWCNYRCPRILFSIVRRSKKAKEENTPSVTASSIGKIIPLLTPLLIPNYVNYRSIMRLMNVFWASIFASWIKTRVWPLEHSSIIDFMKEVISYPT